MFLANVAISRTADIKKKTSVCLPISETDVWTIGFDLPGSGDGGIPRHSNVNNINNNNNNNYYYYLVTAVA